MWGVQGFSEILRVSRPGCLPRACPRQSSVLTTAPNKEKRYMGRHVTVAHPWDDSQEGGSARAAPAGAKPREHDVCAPGARL